jgi:decaprenylphospho-beta-D-erythro-pentofuranosid-2-ulose 2-reductase
VTAPETVVVLGGTTGLGRALAVEAARRGHPVVIGARHLPEAEAAASDLRVRFGVPAWPLVVDALARGTHTSAAAEAEAHAAGGPLGVVMCIGYLGEHARAQQDSAELARVLESNFDGPVSLLERFAERMEARGAGWICIVSSVAGDRGRQSNYLYGAAKAGLSTYADGLRNRLFRAGVHVMLVKPGFVDTAMTFGRPGVRGAAPPDAVAAGIFRALRRRRDTVYLPGIWRVVMTVIRAIPEAVFKRMRL